MIRLRPETKVSILFRKPDKKTFKTIAAIDTCNAAWTTLLKAVGICIKPLVSNLGKALETVTLARTVKSCTLKKQLV